MQNELAMLAQLPERIASKIRILAGEYSEGCWFWTASLNNYGYGRLRDGRQIRAAHRVVYELLVGPVAAGLDLDHLCRVRSCVNPLHVEPVTRSENLRRGMSAHGGLTRWLDARETAAA